MTPAETARVLIKLAAYDQRTIGDGDVAAWHEVVGYLDYTDCLTAVTAHYREQSSRAMPADIRRLAIGIRDDRRANERRAGRQAIEAAPVRDRSAEVTALVRSVADALPKTDIHDRAVARARKERGRPRRDEPKRRKRSTKKPKDYAAPMSDDIAALATRYLVDGHTPGDVAERLAVSRRWCERTVRRFKPQEET